MLRQSVVKMVATAAVLCAPSATVADIPAGVPPGVTLFPCAHSFFYSFTASSAATACQADSGFTLKLSWGIGPDTAKVMCASQNCRAFYNEVMSTYSGPSSDCIMPTGNLFYNGIFAPLTECFTGPQVSAPCGPGQMEMTVEGVNHVFCVNGYGCSGNRDDGACPGKVDGLLPYGSYCGLVRTKVYGCKQYDNPDGRKNSWKINEIDCDVGMIPVSVAGAGTYCAKLPVCVGNAPGNCPSVPRSSTPVRCDVVQPNVYGCTALPPRL